MIRVGLTERHGIADEYSTHAPPGFEYHFVEAKKSIYDKIYKSSAKGIYRLFDDNDIDFYEAPIFPINTKKNWIYTPAEYSGTANFSFFGVPTPRPIRLFHVEQLLNRNNFKKLVFKSKAGLETLHSYGKCKNPTILDKATVVYPAVKCRRENPKIQDEVTNLLFVGEFFRKGGANVVDVFCEINEIYPDLKLTICSDQKLGTENTSLRNKYLDKIHKNKNIFIDKVKRDFLLNKIYPSADIYLCPTYQESFGFSILEAMSFGIPVITSNIFAIPEIIKEDISGSMLDIRDTTFIRNFRGYTINQLDVPFHNYVNEILRASIIRLIKDKALRIKYGSEAIKACKQKFSLACRADKMKKIYEEFV